jgi:hypothetical protein
MSKSLRESRGGRGAGDSFLLVEGVATFPRGHKELRFELDAHGERVQESWILHIAF